MTPISRKQSTFTLFCLLLFYVYNGTANDLNNSGHLGLLRTLSTETVGKTGILLGGGFKYATEMDYTSGPNGTNSIINSNTGATFEKNAPQLISGNIFATYGLTTFWDLGISIPFYYDIAGWNDEDRSGVGDLELSTKMTYPFGRYNSWFTQSYYLKVLFPTGTTKRGFFARHIYYITTNSITDTNAVFTLKSIYFNPQMIWTVDFSKIDSRIPVSLHANFGGVIATTKSNSAVVAAVGIEYRPNDYVSLFTEISGESRVSWYTQVFDIKTFINDPFRLSPGIRLTHPKGFTALIAGDFGISKKSDRYRTNFNRKGYSYATKATPRYGIQISLGYYLKGAQADSDHDGIDNNIDKCVMLPEDRDNFEDTDGCPDIDNDNDGVIDSRDSCPEAPAVCSGCPILDHDNDGITDDHDQCPQKAEDFDTHDDDDGCPDPDNDNDGIFDIRDICPGTAEDFDGFDDTDGCPDYDNDTDGVPDSIDECPNEKGDSESKGCPRAKEIKRGRLILDGVTFETGKAKLSANSFTVLDRVYESLVDWKNVKVEIRGHTDSQGNEKLNMRLSKKRAEAVMQYLLEKGIPPERLKAVGYGESAPLFDNRTAEGRAKNRRVELHRID